MGKRLYTVNDNYFDDLNSEGPSYWLGVLSADGYIRGNSINLTVKEADIEWLTLYKEALEIEAPIQKGPKGCIRVVFTSKRVAQNLVSYGLVQRKSLTLSFCRQVPVPQVKHYVRGLIDGDGSLSLSSKIVRIGLTGTKDIVTCTDNYLRQFTTARSQLRRSSRSVGKESGVNKAFRVNWCGRQNVGQIVKHLYNESSYFLGRKKMLADKIIKANKNTKEGICEHLSETDLKSLYFVHGSWRKVARELGISQKTFSDYKIKMIGKDKVC
jgi:hypothetical protein